MHEVTVTTSGGFAGVGRTVRIDPAKLSAPDRTELEARVAALARAGAAKSRGRQGSEVLQYDIAVNSPSGAENYRAFEGGETPEFAALREFVAAHRQ